ncbi:hypothetical protein LVB87_03260 [Lysobacter sp. KIS68-7]|uniref:hypothetical protein n=1 Tax=Lysobacter sp. KIS68-7 TaxID=2904252 RepID=UPI001E649ABE|nr:hypothetical protein [Lysobacter sp. KIS68-7]UHQ20195.1 hypothetical protein LVB87_03260 [Lysobacter sp. KIS68-7]
MKAHHFLLSAAMTSLVFAILSAPALAGTTQVSAIGVFNNTCQPPVGSPPVDTGDYPPIDLSGSLDGCWYTYVSASRLNPSGTYIEQGTELFVGCLNGTACGTFETTYTFTGKYTDANFTEEIHGRCEHALVDGTGDFADVKGAIKFKDDVVNLKFDIRGHISLAEPGVQGVAKQVAATQLVVSDPARSGGC